MVLELFSKHFSLLAGLLSDVTEDCGVVGVRGPKHVALEV